LPRTAFILETNEEVRSMLTAALEEQQWDVTLCANAQEFALSLAIQPPGVAFLDALMPGKINFIRAFEALALASPGSRIVVTTGEATDYQLDEYVHAAAARLVKPLSPERVRSFVKDQLSSTVLPA
jgi:DNA-binding NtrC family response regulator